MSDILSYQERNYSTRVQERDDALNEVKTLRAEFEKAQQELAVERNIVLYLLRNTCPCKDVGNEKSCNRNCPCGSPVMSGVCKVCSERYEAAANAATKEET